MPIYEYRCQKCHQTFEVLQKLNDKPLDRCPHCHGQLARLIPHQPSSLKAQAGILLTMRIKILLPEIMVIKRKRPKPLKTTRTIKNQTVRLLAIKIFDSY